MERKSIKRTWNDLTVAEREDMIKNQSIVYRVEIRTGKLIYKSYTVTRNNCGDSIILELKDIDTGNVYTYSVYDTFKKYQHFDVVNNDIFLSKESLIVYLIEKRYVHNTNMIDEDTMEEIKLFIKDKPYYLI